MKFSTEKNKKVAMQEHRHLLKQFLFHDLNVSKWAGKFIVEGDKILELHATESGLTSTDEALVRWSIFTESLIQPHLPYSLFDSLIDELMKPVQPKEIPNDKESNLFWEGAKRILRSCYDKVDKIQNAADDKNSMKTLKAILSIISKIVMLEPPDGTNILLEGLNLSTEVSGGWLLVRQNSCDVEKALMETLESEAAKWFKSIVDTNLLNDGDQEAKLQGLIKITELIRADMKRLIKFYDKIVCK